MSIYSDKLAHLQVVPTAENPLHLDDVMSYNSLTLGFNKIVYYAVARGQFH